MCPFQKYHCWAAPAHCRYFSHSTGLVCRFLFFKRVRANPPHPPLQSERASAGSLGSDSPRCSPPLAQAPLLLILILLHRPRPKPPLHKAICAPHRSQNSLVFTPSEYPSSVRHLSRSYALPSQSVLKSYQPRQLARRECAGGPLLFAKSDR